MPPNCTPEKINDSLANNSKESYEADELYFNIKNNGNNEIEKIKSIESRTERQLESLLNDLPELNQLFHVHYQIGEGTFSTVYLATLKNDTAKRKYAVKHLIQTCHPNRIKFELTCLKTLGGKDNIVGIELCLRNKNNVVFIMPYQSHRPFNEYVRDMDAKETSEYIKNLLIAVAHLHKAGIIHRDIKPSNFLYDRKNRRYGLVDFGLAQLSSSVSSEKGLTMSVKRKRDSHSPHCEDKALQLCKRPNLQTISPDVLKKFDSSEQKENRSKENGYSTSTGNKKNKTMLDERRAVLKDITKVNCKNGISLKSNSTHLQINDLKKALSGQENQKSSCHCYGKPKVCSHCLVKRAIQANRAGTPGFRPPEVLLKYPHQTTAVDIWAVGVILISILSSCPSFFSSLSDNMALAEIVTLFGTEKIKQVSQQLGRYFQCSEKKEPVNLKKLCCLLRNRSKNPKDTVCSTLCSKCHGDMLFCNCIDENLVNVFPNSAFDLLERLLDVDPRTRITAEEALQHEFLNL